MRNVTRSSQGFLNGTEMTHISGKVIWRFIGGVFGLCFCFFLPENKNTVAFLRRSNINRYRRVKKSFNEYGNSYASLSKHSQHMNATFFLMRYAR